MLLPLTFIHFISVFCSISEANPAGTKIPSSISLDIPPQGFSGLAAAMTELQLETITVDDIIQDNGCDFTTYSLENLYLDVTVAEVTVLPRQGYLDLDMNLLLSINDPFDPFVFSYKNWVTFCVEDDCNIDILPSIINIQGKIYLDVIDEDNDGKKEVDVTITDLVYDYSDFNDDKINLNGCAISVINAITNFFGVSMVDYIIGLIGPEIENQIEAEIPNFETSIEDALQSLQIEETFTLVNTEMTVKLNPQDISIDPAGMMFVLEGSSETPYVNRCVSGYDLGSSLDTNGSFSPVNEVTGGYHSKIQVNDEFVNQALYTLWRGGLLCFTVDENIFALDTGILNLLSGDAFSEMFPDSQPMVINTIPRKEPVLNMTTQADLAIDVYDMGLDFVTEIDERQAVVLSLDLNTDVGITLPFDPNTGNLTVGLDLDTDRIHTSIQANEFVPDAGPDIVANFGDQLGTILDIVGLDSFLGDISFDFPTFYGVGISDINVTSSGTDHLDASVNLQFGAVPYSTGCNTEEGQGATDNCNGCSAGQSRTSHILFVFTLVMIAIRRRH